MMAASFRNGGRKPAEAKAPADAGRLARTLDLSWAWAIPVVAWMVAGAFFLVLGAEGATAESPLPVMEIPVRIRMDDGREHVEERLQLLGARDRPFDHAEKFREGAAHFLGEPATERALATLRQLHAVDDVRSVMDQFKPH